MRIYLNGTFSNGKTTIKNWIAERYSLSAIPEIARTVLAEHEIVDLSILRANTDLLLNIQTEILERQFKAEQEEKDNYVCCRGLDSVSFLVNFAEDEDVNKFINSKLYKDYVKWLKGSYTFLLKPHKELLKSDGMRDTDWELSLMLFGVVKTLLRCESIPYVLISDINMSERQSVIKGVIDGSQ
jgi:hypothetical protein